MVAAYSELGIQGGEGRLHHPFEIVGNVWGVSGCDVRGERVAEGEWIGKKEKVVVANRVEIKKKGKNGKKIGAKWKDNS